MTPEIIFRDDMTLEEARSALRELVEEGHTCPLCTQFAKVYKRTIHGRMAADLIKVYKTVPVWEWFHLPSVLGYGGDFAKMTHWGLIEEEGSLRDDGGRAGWWRLTTAAEEWIEQRSSMLKYARIYDGRSLGLTGPPLTIVEALGKNFDYSELMAS